MARMLALAVALVSLGSATLAQTAEPAPPAPQTTQPAPAAAQPAPAVAQPVPPPPAQQPAPAPVQPKPAGPKGKLYSWGSVGTTFAYGETYGSVSFGVGYFLIPSGITPNVEVSYNFGAQPTLWAIRPGVTWYTSIPVVRPYFGVHYTRWLVGNDLPDSNAIGGRAGLSLGRFITLGVTYDRLLDCSGECDWWTPTLTAGVSM